jgi:hypothetical protein
MQKATNGRGGCMLRGTRRCHGLWVPLRHIYGGDRPQSTHRGKGEIGEVYLPSQLEHTTQLCS